MLVGGGGGGGILLVCNVRERFGSGFKINFRKKH